MTTKTQFPQITTATDQNTRGNWGINSIQMQITLWAGICLLLVMVVIIGLTANSLRDAAVREAEANAVGVAKTQALEIQGEIETALKAARTMAQALTAVKAENISFTREQVNAMLKQVLEENPSFLGTDTLWEPNAFDGLDAHYANTEGHDETGRFIPYWVRDDEGNIRVEPLLEYETEGIGDWYLRPKRTLQEQIIDPFLYPIQGVDVLLTSLTVPIVVDGQFYGIAGVDIPIDFIQNLADEVNIYDGTGKLVLISNNGTLAGVTGQADLVGQSATKLDAAYENELSAIRAGEPVSNYHGDLLEVFVPVTFGDTTTPWSVNVAIPYEKITAEATNLMWSMIGIGILLVLGALILLYVIAGRIARPIKLITNVAQSVARGDLEARAEITSRDEVGILATVFNNMTTQLRETLLGLEGTVAERTKDLAATIEVGQLVTRVRSQEDLLPQLVEFIRSRFNLYFTQIYLLDEAKRYAILRAGTGEVGAELLGRNHRLDMAETSIVARTVREGEPVLVSDTERSTIHKLNPLLPDTRSEVVIPLVVGGEILGVLDMQAVKAGTFNEDNLSVFQAMAGQIASALRGAQAYDEAQAAVARAEAINQRLVSEAWQPYLGKIGRGEKTGYQYELESPKRLEEDLPHADKQITGDDLLIQPLAVSGQPIGSLVVKDDRTHTWTKEEQALIEDVSERLALALDRFRSFDETELARQEVTKRASEMETVARVGAAATTTLDMNELLQSVVDLTKERFNLYHAHIYLLDEDGRTLVLAAGAGEAGKMMVEGGHSISVDRESSIVATAARTREGVIANNVSQAPNFLPNPLLPETKSEMAIPLIVGDTVIGVLDVQARTKDRFDDQDVQIQSTLAGQIATAVQNARSFEQVEAARQEVERIFSTSIDMIGSSNFEGYFVSLNPAWEETTGYTLEELMSQPFASFVHPDDVEATIAETAKMAEGALVLAFENRYLCKDGTYKWISWRAIPDFEANLIHFVARDVTENKQAEAEIQRRASEMETVAQVSTAATTTLDMNELLQSVADLTKERFNLYHAHIYLLDEDRENLILAAGAGEAGKMMVAGEHSIALNRQGSIVATAARTREGVISNDVTQAPNFMANPLLPDTKSEMAVPMVVGNTVVGVLDVQADVVNRFTNQDVQIQSTLAAQVAAAVQNARSFEQTQFALAQTEMQAQRLAQLNEMGEMLNRAVTLDDILRIAADKTPQIVEADRASIAFVNPESNTFEVLALAGEGGAIPMGSGMPLTGTAILVATEERRAIMVNDAANSEYGDVRNIAQQGINTTMSAPLIASGYAIGTINLGSAKHNAYTQSDMNILLQIAALLASAIENRRLFDQIEASLAQTEALYTGSDRVVRATSMQDVLMAVVESTEIRKLDRANIMLFNEPWDDEPRMDTFATVFAVWEQDGGESRAPVGTDYSISEFPILTLLQPNEPLVINDAEDDERVDENFRDLLINRLQMRSVVFLPLVAGGEWIGVLTAQSTQATPFSDSAVRQMDSLADQAANVLQTLRLIEQQQETVEHLQEVDRLKQQFLANMSHELRTPLNSIIGYSEVLLDGVDGDLTEDAEEDVEAIHDSGKHLLSIINEILDLAKIEAGQMQLDPQEIDLPQFVKDIVHSGQILVKDKDVALEWVEQSEVPMIEADPIRVRQVLWNLISNAVKFTEAGSVTVTYGMHSDREVFVKVEDTGIGMTKEGVGSIFERFSQVDGSSTRRAGGTGLGLTITRQLVRMHGGEVYVESEVGVGSTFLFTLPIKVTEKA